MATGNIELRGVRVHNLQGVDLELPHRKMIVICGVSGSGKTSLALDTLYAEGQRRYIESFSAYTRQFLERLEKPEAESIEGIPPAIAVVRHQKTSTLSSRSTVGTTTEVTEYLRILFARLGHIICTRCGASVRQDTAESVSEQIRSWQSSQRIMLAFPMATFAGELLGELQQRLREEGFLRGVLQGKTFDFGSELGERSTAQVPESAELLVIVDRLTSEVTDQRLVDSLETAFEQGEGQCVLFSEQATGTQEKVQVDGSDWFLQRFSGHLRCDRCEMEYPEQEPRLFSFNSPLGACAACEGFGNINDIDMDLVVPNPNKSLRDGAIAPWNSPAYNHELQELLDLAEDFDLPVDVPFRELKQRHLDLIVQGVPEREFGGLNGFVAWLEKRKYKMHLRVFLSRWKSYRVCETCAGQRLRDEALATRLGDLNIAEVCEARIGKVRYWLAHLDLDAREQQISRHVIESIDHRLRYLETVGLGYLTLNRPIRTLSGGEAQRVGLTSALGSQLVNMLYVLDEPSAGLHPNDVERLVDAVADLRRRDNTVVVVEHEEKFLRRADQIVEIGPGAGNQGGEIVFQGKPEEILQDESSLTGAYLTGRRGAAAPSKRRRAQRAGLRIRGARGNNLRDVDVDFPLGVLCLVTGVSGAGKSTLVQDTLYPAINRRLHQEGPKPLPFDDISGIGQLESIILVDQSPIGRSPRSNPVTYVKAFDEIRTLFADTVDARVHNYKAGHFSFNVAGGRCQHCEGAGSLRIDMQFMPDVFMKCNECGGRRYRKEILEVNYRNHNIADVLGMTVREAFSFFRGQNRIQAKLKCLLEVGLDYLRLGQPANTLSSGEAQRLKLACYLGKTKRGRSLFVLDEPTTGLHFADVVKLLDAFDALVNTGHSLIVVEHNLQLMKFADHIIDLGPGAGEAGGRVVAQGTPEQVAAHPDSLTGRALSEVLAASRQPQNS
ncbi:MAG: excinuclease ABC subunit A [Planctomycetaceae bacterium]|nr:excinuclease ABC subunit A [Planctomycetaceae bacterium]MBP63033.1 excinuclease ABC subunit A [Planctomycetaceae bacterium]